MMDDQTVVIPSVDCDPGNTDENSHLNKLLPGRWIRLSREKSKQQYRQVIFKLFSIFDKHGLRGKMTWMINEQDVKWTERFPELLKQMVARNDIIGLHTHFGGLFGGERIKDENTAFATIEHCKSNLENITGCKCVTHRSGCFYQAEFIYRALKKANFEIVSDVNPGRATTDLEGRLLDNSDIPVDVPPWRHDHDNWLDYNSRTGHFLHVPVSAEGIEMLMQVKFFERKFICWCIHPHEIQDLAGEIDPRAAGILERTVRRMNTELSPVYMNMREWFWNIS